MPNKEVEKTDTIDGLDVINLQVVPGKDRAIYAVHVALPAETAPLENVEIACQIETAIKLLELAGIEELAKSNNWPNFDTAREFYDIRISVEQVGRKHEWVVSIDVNVLPSTAYAILDAESISDPRVLNLEETLIRQGTNRRVSLSVWLATIDDNDREVVYLTTTAGLPTLCQEIANQALEVFEAGLAPSVLGVDDLFEWDAESDEDLIAELDGSGEALFQLELCDALESVDWDKGLQS